MNPKYKTRLTHRVPGSGVYVEEARERQPEARGTDMFLNSAAQ